MKRAIRLVSLTLAILMLLLSAVSCTVEADDNDQSNAGEATSGGTTAPQGDQAAPSRFAFIDENGTVCKIYYSDSYKDTAMYSTVNALKTQVERLVGTSVDLLPASEYKNDGTPALFVGYAGVAEIDTFMDSLKYSDHGIAIVGSSLCVGAHSNANLSKAINALSNAMLGLSKTDGGCYLESEKCKITRGTYGTLKINGAEISEFSIVYESEELLEVVNDFIHNVGLKTGAVLRAKLAADAASPAEHEILVGNVGRAQTNAYYNVDTNTYCEYSVEIDGKTVAVMGRHKDAVKCGLNALAEQIKKQVSPTSVVEYSDEESFDGTFYEDPTVSINERPEGTDLRIAGNNIYFHQSNKDEMIKVRAEYLFESIKHMDADILLLQEVISTWHVEMDTTLEEMGYTLVPTATDITYVPSKNSNYTPIWYRANVVELLDYGYKQYESVKLNPDSYLSSSKSYTWALFLDKATGEKIITITTHFTWAPSDFNPSPTQLKINDAKEVVALVEDLQSEYAGVPIILMGDLNCTSGSEPYKVLDEKFDNVRFVTERYNNINKGTTHTVGDPAVGSSIIDHTLYIANNLNFKMYQHVINDWSIKSTDHIPLIVDVEFK